MIELGDVEVEGVRIAYRRLAGDGAPTVFVHGNPTDSRQWLPFLERIDGPAIGIDLPGFGRSERPAPDRYDYSMHGLARSFRGFLDALGVDRHRLVVQDWGALALIAAQAEPDRVERLVVLNSVPLLPGYRWHRIARVWRSPLGRAQLAMATRRFASFVLREARPGFQPLPDAFFEMVWSNLSDPGTRAAILALYRAADPPRLALAGSRLGALRCPALVAWGGTDPYIGARFGPEYARRLPDATLLELPDAGHWAWLDRPDLIDRAAKFLADGSDLDSHA